MIDLGAFSGHTTRASAINNRTQVAGTGDTASGNQHAIVWQAGTMTDLGTLGGLISAAYGINDRGQIVGNSLTANGQWHAFLWENGTMTDLGRFDASAINNQGQVVGSAGGHAVSWQGGVLTDLGPPTVRATGINDNGTIVGLAHPSVGVEHGFVWQHGVITDLGTLGGEHTTVGGINNQDQIVGMSSPAGQTPPGPEHAFLWQRGKMIDLTTVGLRMDSFVGVINNKGSIAGTSGGRAALFTARSAAS